jgi:hypothetical protein
MIRLPRRSVTRFFIPLIDVLTLLFCIFLLMPVVQVPDESSEPAAQPAGMRGDPQSGRRKPPGEPEVAVQERQELERRRKEQEQWRHDTIETLQQRLAIRVLEIDADTGKLYYYEPEGRVEIASQADAQALIQRQRRAVQGRELYYLFLFPRRLTGYPEERQVQQYERWFATVAHGFDNPRGGR